MSGQVRSSVLMGLGPQPLSTPAGGNLAFPLEIYQTSLLDLTLAHLNVVYWFTVSQ